MADRTVKVTLRANVTDFNQQVKQASKSLEDVVRAGDKTGKVADTGLGRMAQRAQLMGSEMTTAGTAIGAFGAGLLAVSGNAVRVAADFDAAMSVVKADTHETAANMDRLRDAAIKAGADTVFSATEAAGAIDELAKAGVSTNDILSGGLTGSLNLAAAGGIAVSDAAETAASAMTQFGLSGKDVTHVADLLAAGAGKAQGGVNDLGEALNNVGVVAGSMGISIEETTGTLAAFASTGLVGAEAGTALKSMLNALRSPSKKAAETMAELGIAAYDQNGKFVGLANIAGQLRTSMSSLSQEQRDAAMSTIFGSYAVTAASILYQQGAGGINDWTNKVNDSGYAAETAAARMDNLKGDLEQLGGSLETAWINLGSGAQGPLRGIVQSITDVVNAFNGLPAPVQQSVLLITGLAGAGTLAAGAFMTVLPRIVETKAAMETLGISFSAAGKKLGEFAKGHKVALAGVATAIVGVGAAMDLISSKFEASATSVETMTKAMESGASGTELLATAFKNVTVTGTMPWDQTDALQDFGETLRYAADPGFLNSAGQGIADFLGQANSTDLGQIRTQFEKLGDALSQMDSRSATKAFNDIVNAAGGGAEAAKQLLDVMPSYRSHLESLAAAAGMATDDTTLLAIATGKIDVSATEAGGAMEGAAGATGQMGDAAGDAAAQLDELVEGMTKLAQATLTERDAQRGFYEAISSASETIKENGAALDITTEKGRENQAAIDGIANATWKLVDSMRQQGASASDMQAAMAEGREALISAAQAAGMTADEAAQLADQLGLIPDAVHVDVDANTQQALQQTYDVVAEIDGMSGIISIDGVDYNAKQTLDNLLGIVADSEGNINIGGNTVPANQSLYDLLGIVNNGDGTITINGDNGPATLAANSVKVKIDRTTGAVRIEAKDAATGAITRVQGMLAATKDKTVTLRVNEVRYSKTIREGGYAAGGPVYGPGSGTSDSIPARLSNGEHVWTAAEVRAAGGQGRVMMLRAMARAGMLARDVLGFAAGGPVGATGYSSPALFAAPASSARRTSLTVVLENPMSGERLERHIASVADGRIVYASNMGV